MPITFAGDTDDHVRFPNSASWNDIQQKSIFQTVEFTTDYVSAGGRILWKTPAGLSTGWSIAIDQPATNVFFTQTADGGSGIWSALNIGIVIPNNYFSIGVSMDIGDITNTPLMYLDGIGSTFVEENPPSGTFHTDGSPTTDFISLGNVDTPSAGSGIIGTISGGLVFNKLLSPAEFLSLHEGNLTLDLMASLVYAPLLLGADGKLVFTGALSSSNFVYCHMTGSKGTPSGSPVAVPESRLAFPFAYG